MSSQSSKDFEIYRALVENSLDAQYVLDRTNMEFVLVNSAFSDLTGYEEKEVLKGKLNPRAIVLEEDWDVVQKLDQPQQKIETFKFEFRLVRKDGITRQVENCVRNIEINGRPYRIGSMRDNSNRVRFERILKEEIQSEKQKINQVAKANVRIYQLTERIEKVPQLTARLLNVQSEQELLEEAAEVLCGRGRKGLNYNGVTFLIKKEDWLEVSYSTRPLTKLRYNTGKASRYAKIFRGELQPDPDSAEEYIVPIQSKEKDIGLMHVYFHPDEKLLFDQKDSIRAGQRDIIRTIGNNIGLVIDNLRLMYTIKQQSIKDQLTQTYNRRFFTQKVKDEFKRAYRYNRFMSILIIDIDKFKYINDTFGHLQGDVILKDVSKIFRENTREQDILCRYGGDEFVLLFPETDKEDACQKAERLRVNVESHEFPCLGSNKKLRLSISVGVASINPQVTSEMELFRHADEALYDSKRKGRNVVSSYD